MTYIKWKDEVESYLISLPREEKQKIFSYFSEMYADKRDAGISEEQIIEEFGAPYDVAKKILADSREAATPPLDAKNLGGKEIPEMHAPQSQADPFANGIPMPQPKPAPAKKRGAGHVILSVIFIILLASLTVSLIGSALTAAIDGFITIGAASGALAAGECGGAEGTALIGTGLISAGAGILLLAPFSALCSVLWRKLKKFVKGA